MSVIANIPSNTVRQPLEKGFRFHVRYFHGLCVRLDFTKHFSSIHLNSSLLIWFHPYSISLFQLPSWCYLVDDENFRVISQQIGSLCVCYYPQVHAHFAPVFLQLTTEKILAWLYGIFVIHPWQMTLFRTHFFIPQFLFRLMNGIDAAAKLQLTWTFQ